MLTGTIFITLGILTGYFAWHFWRNRHTFKESFDMYKDFLQKKENVEQIDLKRPKKR